MLGAGGEFGELDCGRTHIAKDHGGVSTVTEMLRLVYLLNGDQLEIQSLLNWGLSKDLFLSYFTFSFRL